MNYVIAIGLPILFFIVCCVIHEIVTNYLLPKTSTSSDPILTITKNGGIAGLSYRLDIYDNRNYVLFSRGKEIRKGIMDNDKYTSARYLIVQVPIMKNEYCKVDGFDMIYYGLEHNGKIINFGSPETGKNCLPSDIYNNLMNLNSLMI